VDANERHLTPEQLCERLGVELRTLYSWKYHGEGPRAIKVGRLLRYRLADVIAWEESRLVGKSA
jgi:excisionase family DNA binding protein